MTDNNSKIAPGYIVNFLRDRDSYVIPRALASKNQLTKLVTDIYFTKGPSWRQRMLAHLADHHSPELDAKFVEESLAAAAVQFLGGRKLSKVIDTHFLADRILARKTASIWKRQPADLLLYSGYARSAFLASKGSNFRRLLFLYHPHHRIISDLLRADASLFPESEKAFKSDREVKTWWRWRYADDEIELADAVVTASTFSQHSLEYAGFDKPTAVVPYFSKLRADEFNMLDKKSDICRFLFVGQGVIRKGLHHLLRAWREAKLRNATLTCVCGQLDPNIVALIPSDVIIKKHLSHADLQAEYSRSHVFVMPSIIEGFGLVYNEARSYGNYIIYTPNTGAPDMQIDDKSGESVPVGNVSELAGALIKMNERFHNKQIDFAYIAGRSHSSEWDDYVARLIESCEALKRLC
ncbi:glycosyltransferase family 4 protein [Bradyrhizobium sp. DASA03076]|uniref:glycosyltransferase family 4 protein n=1 Tax=Bradyrhizobium sp. BLXBL-03 TaxID=3395916 RepID=UPI003F7157F0